MARNTTGVRNTAVSRDAMLFNITGNDNTGTGESALFNNTSGVSNTAIGHNTDVSQGDLTNATAIGASAIVDASNKIQLGDDNVIEVQINGYTKLDLTSSAPPAADYDEASERGRMKVNNVDRSQYTSA